MSTSFFSKFQYKITGKIESISQWLELAQFLNLEYFFEIELERLHMKCGN